MKRKTDLGIAMAVMMTIMLCGCGSGKGTPSEDSNSDSGTSITVTSTEDMTLDSSNELIEKTTEPEVDSGDNTAEDNAAEDNVVFIKEYKIHLPGDFEKMHEGYRTIYKNETDSGAVVYYSRIYIPDYSSLFPEESYSLDDVPEITWEYILEDMRALNLPAGASKSECEIDEEEKRQIFGIDVTRRTGTIHLKKSGKEMDLSYAAYYMLTDLQNGDYKNVPVVWIAFSEDTSDETRKYLEEVVDYSCEHSEIKEN